MRFAALLALLLLLAGLGVYGARSVGDFADLPFRSGGDEVALDVTLVTAAGEGWFEVRAGRDNRPLRVLGDHGLKPDDGVSFTARRGADGAYRLTTLHRWRAWSHWLERAGISAFCVLGSLVLLARAYRFDRRRKAMVVREASCPTC